MRTSPRQYFATRWRGTVPLPRLLWRDTVVVGSLINLIAALASVIAWERGVGPAAAAVIFFSPLPYNLFLLLAVWRSSEAVGEPNRTIARIVAGFWMFIVTAL